MAWMIWGSQKTQETSLNIAIKGQWSFTISISLIDICLVLKKRFHQLGHGVSFIACHAQESLLHPFLRLYGWMDGWMGGWWVDVGMCMCMCHAMRRETMPRNMRCDILPPDLSQSPPAPEVSQSPKAADVTLPATRVSWQCCGTLEMNW